MIRIERQALSISTPQGSIAAYCVRPRGSAIASAVFVHGKTFPSVPDFDLQVPGAESTYSFMEYLAQRRIYTWCFDHRGFGASWKPPEGTSFTAAERADDLHSVVRTVRYRSPGPLTLVGLSLGCSAVAAAMHKAPRLAEKVVLMGPARWQNFDTLTGRLQAVRSRLKARARKSRYVTVDLPTLEQRLWAGEEAVLNRQAFEQFVRQSIDVNPDGPRDAVSALISEVVPFAGRPSFNVPVLALRGSDDTLATARDLEAVARFVPPELLTLRTFPRLKHDLHLYNDREAVFSCLHDYITTAPAPQAHGRHASTERCHASQAA